MRAREYPGASSVQDDVNIQATPTTRTFSISANGAIMGEYPASCEADALDAYARDAGYDDYDDLLEQLPAGRDDAGARAVELTVEVELDGPCGPVVDYSDGSTPEAIEREIPRGYEPDYTSQIRLANGQFRCPLVRLLDDDDSLSDEERSAYLDNALDGEWDAFSQEQA